MKYAADDVAGLAFAHGSEDASGEPGERRFAGFKARGGGKVSKEAWKMWVERMKMIMNEYGLNLGQPDAQEFLLKQMEEYFFGDGGAAPPDFVPESTAVH